MMQMQNTDLRSEMMRRMARPAHDAPVISREDATSCGAAIMVVKSNRPSAYAVSVALGTASPDGPEGTFGDCSTSAWKDDRAPQKPWVTDVSARQEERRQASAIRRGDLMLAAICAVIVVYALIVWRTS